jgi:hypothetical protein
VRRLETRIQDLEKDLAIALEASRMATNPPGTSNDLEHVDQDLEDIMLDEGDLDILALNATNVIPGNYLHDPRTHPGHGPSGSLPEELKLLSLEATAERYLGSSSGFSFARLTQTVLRRLSPDKVDFVFGHDGETEQQGAHDSPSDALNSVFYSFNNTISCYPTLFGSLALSDITEPEDVVADLRLPDQSHVDRLVDFYFAHSHTLYPILHRGEFMSALEEIRSNDQSSLAQSPLCLFRIWMVLAIGSTAYCSVTLVEESEPMLYYSKAMMYFEPALGYGDMVCMSYVLTMKCG